jgi:hypothetical protein
MDIQKIKIDYATLNIKTKAETDQRKQALIDDGYVLYNSYTNVIQDYIILEYRKEM